MSMETAMVAKLLADATVSGYVGTRVYAHIAPQTATYPLLIFKRTGDEPLQASASRESKKTVKTTVTIDCFATDYYVAKALAVGVRTELDSWRDQTEGTAVDSFRWLSQTEDCGVESEGSSVLLYQVSQVYEAWIVET